jgi:RHS repeat-associated protein
MHVLRVVGGVQVSVTNGSGSTASSVATALASAINANNSIAVTASASSSTINLTEKTQGSDPALTVGSSSNYPTVFTSPSFSAAAFGPDLNVSNAAQPMSLLTPAVTLYTYDTLDDLTCVEQHGNVSGTGCASSPSNDASSPWRVRRFTYDSLGRLTQASNPESGTISYTYDSDGNLLTRTDARSITTSYSYDQLHRLTQESYSDSTPTVKTAYDGPTVTGCTSPTLSSANPIGRRSSMCDGAGWEAWSYDSRGHVTVDRRNTNSVTKDTTYGYNFAGGETTVAYPSGRTITYTYNPAAQVTSASDVANSITYASNAHYTPPGGLAFLQEGSGISSTYIFNNRLQPCWMYSTTSTPTISWATTQCTDTATTATILDFKYNFSLGTADNGNVTSITNNINAARSQSFTYDELNRILTARTQATTGTYAWGLNFGYDAWADMLNASVSQGSAYTLSAAIDPTHPNNRLLGYSYDASGNMLSDGNNNYTFDAESQLKTAANTTYTYDGNGNRVQKSNGKLYWRGDGSDSLDETDASGNLTDEYIFFGGKRIARRDPSNNVDYYFDDHLGTTHVVTNASGTIQDDSDFYPFGGERPYLSSSGNTYKFTSKERDSETGLDDFGARYYSSGLGRFVSADWSAIPTPVPYADFGDPQSLNLYTYVRNIPTTKVDPDGHACSASLLNTDSGYCQRADLYGNLDALVQSKTRFFAAASATSQDLADLAVPGLGKVGTSPSTREFLESTGEALQKVNLEMAGKILSGDIKGEGPKLDAQLVHKEQNAVQGQLDKFKGANPDAYKTAIKEINTLLNSKDSGGAVLKGLVAGGNLLFGTDKAYSQILDQVRKNLGHDIDFSKQKDREAIGNAVVDYIRKTGGCSVAGDKISGCGDKVK